MGCASPCASIAPPDPAHSRRSMPPRPIATTTTNFRRRRCFSGGKPARSNGISAKATPMPTPTSEERESRKGNTTCWIGANSAIITKSSTGSPASRGRRARSGASGSPTFAFRSGSWPFRRTRPWPASPHMTAESTSITAWGRAAASVSVSRELVRSQCPRRQSLPCEWRDAKNAAA
jgi:hypothetical protein